jgi:hypothetical protein
MKTTERLDDDHQVIDEFFVARLLDIKVGNVRGLRRRGLGPEWFRVDGKSPRYTLGSVKDYIQKVKQRGIAPEIAI